MKERPILFSAPMVRAILAGRTNQTRRVVKCSYPWEMAEDDNGKPWPWYPDYVTGGDSDGWVECPHGQPGGRLWVREAWRVAQCYDGKSGAELDGVLSARNVQYCAAADLFLGVVQGRYRHARFMPRWASRITIEITGVRVERLQDISESDAIAEGCELVCMTPTGDDNGSAIHGPDGYAALWESINGPGSWDANPWVWVVEFKRAAQRGEGDA